MILTREYLLDQLRRSDPDLPATRSSASSPPSCSTTASTSTSTRTSPATGSPTSTGTRRRPLRSSSASSAERDAIEAENGSGGLRSRPNPSEPIQTEEAPH